MCVFPEHPFYEVTGKFGAKEGVAIRVKVSPTTAAPWREIVRYLTVDVAHVTEIIEFCRYSHIWDAKQGLKHGFGAQNS